MAMILQTEERKSSPHPGSGPGGIPWRSHQGETLRLLLRLTAFFGLMAALVFGLHAGITSGFRRMQTTQYGALNRIMQGRVNADIVVTGSSRAASHYDPRILQSVTGKSTFNIGRNGSQTDMQVAVLRAYLKHNRKPAVVVHNLDAFSFQTSKEVYDPAYYMPYLQEEEFYAPLVRIRQNIWKSRYLPLYGYVVEDMNFAWTVGLRAFFGWSPPENSFLGFDPRVAEWTDEFQRFKENNPQGVNWDVEPAGVTLIEGLIRLCRERGIQLVFVYSPEYAGMQRLTKNREQVFGQFQRLATEHQVPFWDYSTWAYAGNTDYFSNSQHLNAAGATLFSEEVASRLAGFLAGSPAVPVNSTALP